MLKTPKTGPDPIDSRVGANVRARRKALALCQIDLAAKIDLTFQQVQKYERGTNRISASVLYKIAKALRCTVQDFYTGVETADAVTTAETFPTAISSVVDTAYAIDRSNAELLPMLATLDRAQLGDIARIATHMVPHSARAA